MTTIIAQPVVPRAQDLYRAASEFSAWLQNTIPGARAFICGGFALSMHGNQRTTADVDIGIDLSQAVRRDEHGQVIVNRIGQPRLFDVNVIKQIASQVPQISVGPKIYWILDYGTPEERYIQVDFISAIEYFQPWDPSSMISMVTRNNVWAMCLTLPMLFVAKVRCAIERSQANHLERLSKQINDIQDAGFALTACVERRIHFTQPVLMHLGNDPEVAWNASMGPFLTLVNSLLPTECEPFTVQTWNNALPVVGLPAAWVLSPVVTTA